MKIKKTILFSIFLSLVSCNTTNCREMNMSEKKILQPELDPMNKTPAADRVRVYKLDGTLQCDMGKEIPLNEMQKQLKEIKVISANKMHDGMMRPQVCGAATGHCNVYEISREDLQLAIQYGFSEWKN